MFVGAILVSGTMRARQEKPVIRGPVPSDRATHEGVPAAVLCKAASRRESLLQIRQMALDVSRPLTPCLS
jgi:hypothetical protein